MPSRYFGYPEIPFCRRLADRIFSRSHTNEDVTSAEEFDFGFEKEFLHSTVENFRRAGKLLRRFCQPPHFKKQCSLQRNLLPRNSYIIGLFSMSVVAWRSLRHAGKRWYGGMQYCGRALWKLTHLDMHMLRLSLRYSILSLAFSMGQAIYCEWPRRLKIVHQTNFSHLTALT